MPEISQNELDAIKAELRYWKNAAHYLADCQAATLIGLPKATSKRARRRFVMITKRAVQFLSGEAPPGSEFLDMDRVLRRCEKAVKENEESP